MIAFAEKSSRFLARPLAVGVLLLGLVSNARADLTTGLVAYYPFDGNASDMSGNGNHGTVHGATLGVDRHGAAGKAYSFDGVDDYIDLDDQDFTSAVTFSLWVHFNSLTSYQSLITKYDGDTGQGDQSIARSLMLYKHGDHAFWWCLSENGTVNSERFSPTTASAGQWYHLSSSFGQGTAKIFLNGGEEKAWDTGYTSIFQSNVHLVLGVTTNDFPAVGDLPFNGTLDEVRIYNRALSSAEVAALYQLESTPPNQPPVFSPSSAPGATQDVSYRFDLNAMDADGDYVSVNASPLPSWLSFTQEDANVTTFAGSGTQGSADGTGTAASFYKPSDLATDGEYLYVADNWNNKIRRVEISTGVVTTFAGSGSQGATDATGTGASFHNVTGITTDSTYLYVVDYNNHKIRKVEIATGVVTTLAGSGSQGSTDGVGTGASFNHPEKITTDGTYLFVADTNNHKIRKVVIATGEVTTFAGSGTAGSTDGIGTNASFDRPSGLVTNGTFLYVTDRGTHKIRKIEIDTGQVTTLAGTGSPGSTDANGTSASFNDAVGLALHGQDSLRGGLWKLQDSQSGSCHRPSADFGR